MEESLKIKMSEVYSLLYQFDKLMNLKKFKSSEVIADIENSNDLLSDHIANFNKLTNQLGESFNAKRYETSKK